MLSTPELELAEAEAKALADACNKVSEHYDNKLNPKMLAWFNLTMVAGGLYGTRVYAIRARQQKEAEDAKNKPGAPKIVNISGGKIVPGPGANAQAPVTPADIFGLGYGASIPDAL